MLKRFAKNSYFCYLHEYSGFFQIPIHPNEEEKTTFTCTYGTYAHAIWVMQFPCYILTLYDGYFL